MHKRLNKKIDAPPGITFGKFNTEIVYPTIRQFEIRAKYNQLSVDKKERLEELIGETPFDLINTLRKNKLLGNGE